MFGRPVLSDSLQPHGLQHNRPPCPSPCPGICLSSCSLHWWCSPTISPLTPSSFTSLNFPIIRDFSNESAVHIRWPKYWSFSIPVNIQSWFPLRLTNLISLLSKELSGVFLSTTVWMHRFFGILPSLQSNSHKHTWPLGRPSIQFSSVA